VNMRRRLGLGDSEGHAARVLDHLPP